MSDDCERYWFTNLSDIDKKYIIDHPDPSKMIYYLQRGINFDKALRLGYIDSVKEDMEINKNLQVAAKNVKTNLML